VNAARLFPQIHADALGARNRALAIVAIFVAIGPPMGACVIWLVFSVLEPMARHAIITTSSFDLAELFLVSLMLSYKAGGALAALTGVAVALFRHFNGRTTLATPIVAVLIANVAGILFYNAITGSHFTLASYLIGFIPPSLIAALVCWHIARRMGLA
jgi:hypothetical protein